MKKDLLYLILPAYNEEANIESVIKQYHPICEKLEGNASLVILNDGSKDKTKDVLETLSKQYPYLKVINKKNSGHGATCLEGYRLAINDGAEYIFQTDSDGQTDPEEFWQFWDNRENYDIQVGYRNKRQDGIDRIFVTKVLRYVVWLTFGKDVTDANTPFRLMKSEKLTKILKVIPEDFFLSNVAISAIAVKWNYKTKWYPITFKPRQGGENSINFKKIVGLGWKALGDLWNINKNLRNNEKI